MPDHAFVVNSTPLIALAAAGCVGALPLLYERVVVPLEVAEEICVGDKHWIGATELDSSIWLDIQTGIAAVPAYLANALDRGEAAVIATALDRDMRLLCIDATVGRRMARLAALERSGSLGLRVNAFVTKGTRIAFPHRPWPVFFVFFAADSSRAACDPLRPCPPDDPRQVP